MTNQAKTNKLKYLIDSTFSKVNRLFYCHLKMKSIRHLLVNKT